NWEKENISTYLEFNGFCYFWHGGVTYISSNRYLGTYSSHHASLNSRVRIRRRMGRCATAGCRICSKREKRFIRKCPADGSNYRYDYGDLCPLSHDTVAT